MTDVLVIGAGPAGLCSGYELKRAGITYEIVDRADHPGSTWANLYPSLKLNTAGFVSHMPGMRMPLRYGLLPSGRDYYAHLSAWARRNPLCMRLGVEVAHVRRGARGWCVTMNSEQREFPTVILASGRFSNPYIPDIPGMASFDGKLLHARDFRDPASFRGLRTLVVGSGPSGADIAVALAEQTPGQVLLAIRSDIVVARRNPYGLNETIWKLLIHRLPQRWQKPLSDRLLYQSYPGLRHLGLPLAPNREDRKGTSVPIRGPEFVRAVRNGHIRAVRGLAALEGGTAILDDGTRHEVDVVILATGYRPALSYLGFGYETDEQGWPLRIHPASTHLRDAPGIFLVGRFYRGLGAFHSMRGEARTAAREIAEYLQSRCKRHSD
jgi:cation diffusion facilitator CzcD-associated flavoprotein CzcO